MGEHRVFEVRLLLQRPLERGLVFLLQLVQNRLDVLAGSQLRGAPVATGAGVALIGEQRMNLDKIREERLRPDTVPLEKGMVTTVVPDFERSGTATIPALLDFLCSYCFDLVHRIPFVEGGQQATAHG
jgi:hypothetical protein